MIPVCGVRSDGSCRCNAGKNCLKPGKHPLLDRWQTSASSSAGRIKEFWLKSGLVNVAVHLGASNVSLLVLDVDPRNGGNDSLTALEAELGRPLRDASELVVATGGDGWHFYFDRGGLTDSQVSTVRSWMARNYPGIDVLAGAHYCILPPSNHASGGSYRLSKGDWDIEWLTLMPGELLQLAEGECADTDSVGGLSADDVLGCTVQSDAETTGAVERLKSALVAIPAECDRDTWRNVLFAVHSTGWQAAEQIARDWSMTYLDPVRGYSKASFDAVWQSAKDERSRPVTLGTVFHLAKEGGWLDPRQQRPTGGLETYGDLSNGDRFARKFHDKFLCIPAGKSWYVWDGLRWLAGANAEALEAAKRIAVEITDETLQALRSDPTEANKRAHTQALSVHRNARRLDSMLAMAATVPSMSVASSAVFDADPLLLGVQNGTLDLRIGELLVASPAHRISKQANAPFELAAKCPRWEQFLAEVFAGDEELIAFLQRVVGYCLTGSVEEEVLFYLYGRGRNGKSVFCTLLEAMLGDYAVSVGSALLTKQTSSEGARYVATLEGARLASANEVGTSNIWDDERVKALVSRDRIATRQLYGEAYSFNPTHKLIVRGNHLPGVHDAGDGMWRRMVLVPFSRQFTDVEVVADLDAQLIRGELPGILAWAVRGCLEWQRNGLRIPASIRRVTSDYRNSTDLLGLFIEECTIADAKSDVSVTVLYARFEGWCKSQGTTAPSAIAFGRQLTERGFTMRQSNSKRLYRGLHLRDEWS